MEKLENKLIDMREMYQDYKEHPLHMMVKFLLLFYCFNFQNHQLLLLRIVHSLTNRCTFLDDLMHALIPKKSFIANK